MTQELVRQKPADTEQERYPNYRVVLHNDNRNSVDFVAQCLMRHLPGMSSDRAWQLTMKVHDEGLAVVFVGPREVAEMYYELLKSEGLTVSLEPEA